jgi:hypothetical protein
MLMFMVRCALSISARFQAVPFVCLLDGAHFSGILTKSAASDAGVTVSFSNLPAL